MRAALGATLLIATLHGCATDGAVDHTRSPASQASPSRFDRCMAAARTPGEEKECAWQRRGTVTLVAEYEYLVDAVCRCPDSDCVGEQTARWRERMQGVDFDLLPPEERAEVWLKGEHLSKKFMRCVQHIRQSPFKPRR